MSTCHLQGKLGLALKEFRLLHAQSSRGSVPMNQLIFPPALKYLPVWSLGEEKRDCSLQTSACFAS